MPTLFFCMLLLVATVIALPPLGIIHQKKTASDGRFKLNEVQYQALYQHLMNRDPQSERSQQTSSLFASGHEPFHRAIQNILLKKYLTRT